MPEIRPCGMASAESNTAENSHTSSRKSLCQLNGPGAQPFFLRETVALLNSESLSHILYAFFSRLYVQHLYNFCSMHLIFLMGRLCHSPKLISCFSAIFFSVAKAILYTIYSNARPHHHPGLPLTEHSGERGLRREDLRFRFGAGLRAGPPTPPPQSPGWGSTQKLAGSKLPEFWV